MGEIKGKHFLFMEIDNPMKLLFLIICFFGLMVTSSFAQTPQLDTTLNSGSACTPGSNPEQCPGTCVVGSETASANISTGSCVVPQGDFVIVTATAVRPADNLTMTDTVGDQFTLVSSSIDGACYPFTDTVQTGGGRVFLFYIASAKGGSPNVFTNTPAGGNSALEIHVSAWKNMTGWTPDRCATANGSNSGPVGTPYSSGSKTTNFNGELIFGYTFPIGNATPGSGFNGLSFVNGDWDEYEVQSTKGSTAAIFTQDTANGTWLSTMTTFAAPVIPTSTFLYGKTSISGSTQLR